MLGTIARERRDALSGQEVAHGRVDVLVRSADVDTLGAQQRRERRHRGSTDPDEMRSRHDTAASVMTIWGCGSVDTWQCTPSGSVHAGPAV